MQYPKYTTTVVGSHSVPRWYEALEKQVEVGALSKADMADAQFRSSQAAILDQEIAGIDIITGGEMHRRTNNRHAPPNGMLNFFWERMTGFAKGTRPKNITIKDPNVFHPAAVLTGPLSDKDDLGLVDEYKMVSMFARQPAKITMTGPHMLAKVAYDEYYNDLPKFMMELAKVMNRNYKALEAAGCKYLQIDEPLFAIADDAEVKAAVDAINASTEGLKMSVQVHICQGNYARGADYDGQIGHRYFDFGRYPAKLISEINCDTYLVEGDLTPQYEGLLGNKQIAVGAADVQSLNIESPETIAERIHTWGKFLAPEQTMITSSCGLNHLPRHIAFGKLQAMVGAKRILGG